MAQEQKVSFEVVATPESGGKSMFDKDAFPILSNLDLYRPPKDKSIEVARKLEKNGISVHHIGEFSISASCSSKKFETFFRTKISQIKPPAGAKVPKGYVMRAPRKGAPWKLPTKDSLDTLIDRAYIQRPPICLRTREPIRIPIGRVGERPIPPSWNDKFRLRVPVDVAQIMRASSVHRRGITGKGVKAAMPDTGFYHHPYFVEQGYNFLAITAPDTVNPYTDRNGHGTGECANLFATAPGINFIGIKYNNATLAFNTAVELRPDIITCSWCYNYDRPGSAMPNWLRPLHLSVLSAVARGITVVFAAGNGHYAFPGSMPEVISVGGVVVDEDLKYSASEYTSGFMSTWFPGRRTPDICGLCGNSPADYIILPVQSNSNNEKEKGWGAFSGTSAAAPMVAGICALLKEANPALTPLDIKNFLKHTARDITSGTNAHGNTAAAGPDDATGFGLADARRAIEVVL